jgi:hypothetical protein
MHAKTQKSVRAGRFGRAALVLGVLGTTAGGMVLGTGVAQAAVGNNPGAVNLNPTSGSTTTVGCNAGFQGSAVFREVHSDGKTTNTISPVVNGTSAKFSGTLQASLAQIQAAGGIANGHSQELVVICFSGPSLTGSSSPEMDIYVHYGTNGTYTTSTTP